MGTRKTRQIAPRLADGYCRVGFGARFPEAVKEGLRAIARDENKSMNWVLEETVIRYFELHQPQYISESKKPARVLQMKKRA